VSHPSPACARRLGVLAELNVVACRDRLGPPPAPTYKCADGCAAAAMLLKRDLVHRSTERASAVRHLFRRPHMGKYELALLRVLAPQRPRADWGKGRGSCPCVRRWERGGMLRGFAFPSSEWRVVRVYDLARERGRNACGGVCASAWCEDRRRLYAVLCASGWADGRPRAASPSMRRERGTVYGTGYGDEPHASRCEERPTVNAERRLARRAFCSVK